MSFSQLAQRGLQVGALGLELLDVGHGLGVLLLGQRVDRAELLAAAREPLQARVERLALLVGSASSAGSARELQPLGDPPSSRSASAAWSRARWRRTSAWVSASFSRAAARVQLGLLLRAGAQLDRDVLAGLAIGGQRLVEARQPLRDRAGDLLQRRDHLGHRGHELTVARRARRGPARSAARARPARARRARASGARRRARPPAGQRRPASGPSSGAARRRSISALDAALLLAQLVQRADRGAMGVGQPVARRVGLATSQRWRAPAPARGVELGLARRALTRRSAARGGCARPARAPPPPPAPGAARRVRADQTRPAARDGDAAEVRGHALRDPRPARCRSAALAPAPARGPGARTWSISRAAPGAGGARARRASPPVAWPSSPTTSVRAAVGAGAIQQRRRRGRSSTTAARSRPSSAAATASS